MNMEYIKTPRQAAQGPYVCYAPGHTAPALRAWRRLIQDVLMMTSGFEADSELVLGPAS
jgi:hypothetical protein